MFRATLIAYCADALAHYGSPAQVEKAIEECEELVEALSRFQATPGVSQGVRRTAEREAIGEIADVLIMAEQMRLLFGPAEVDAAILEKIDRQRGRMLNDRA